MCACSGEILHDGENLLKKKPKDITKRGVIHVPEGRRVFPGLTVEENLESGTVNWRGLRGRGDYSEQLKEVFELFPRLEERKKQLGWSLSGGEQQMLAIGRGLMAKPRLLLLDEPSMGLAPLVVAELFEKIVEINRRGISILLVEQNARLALRVSHRAYVLERGRISMEGTADELKRDPRIIESYMGTMNTKRQDVKV